MTIMCEVCGAGSPVPPGVVALAAVAATWAVMVWLAGRGGLSRLLTVAAGALGVLGAFWGGHAYVVLDAGAGRLLEEPGLLLQVWEGGKGVLGAFVGAGLAAMLLLAVVRRPFWDYVEVWLPAVALGYGLARLACFINGDDFGVVSSLPWAVQFPEGSYAYAVHLGRGWIQPSDVASLPVHPTQLYHALAGFAGFLLLIAWRPAWPGGRVALALGFYGVTRFLIEFLRDDYRQSAAVLDTAQWWSIAFVVAAAALWAWHRWRPPHVAAVSSG